MPQLPESFPFSPLLSSHGDPQDRRHSLAEIDSYPLLIVLHQRRVRQEKEQNAGQKSRKMAERLFTHSLYRQHAAYGREDDVAINKGHLENQRPAEEHQKQKPDSCLLPSGYSDCQPVAHKHKNVVQIPLIELIRTVSQDIRNP